MARRSMLGEEWDFPKGGRIDMVGDKRGFTDRNIAWPNHMPLVLLVISFPGVN